VALTLVSFREEYPEFVPTPDAVVEAKLAAAANGCDERVFGARYDEAVGLLAAHKLSLSPFGSQARLEKDSTKTTYSEQWTELARQCAGGAWFVGQVPT